MQLRASTLNVIMQTLGASISRALAVLMKTMHLFRRRRLASLLCVFH